MTDEDEIDHDPVEHLGRVEDVDLDENGVLLVRWEEGGVSALEAPPWLLEMDDDARACWRQVEGGLQWGRPEHVIQLPLLKVDLVGTMRDLGLAALPTEQGDKVAALGKFIEERVTRMSMPGRRVGTDVDAEIDAMAKLVHRMLVEGDDDE